MKLERYLGKDEQKKYLDFMKNAEWGAGKFLYQTIVDGKYFKKFGESAKLFFLLDEGNPISFINIVERDYIKTVEFDRWIALLYIDPKYRGQGLSLKMIGCMEEELKKDGFNEVHIATQHFGLYEKMGYKLVKEVYDSIHDVDYIYEKGL